MCLLASEQLKNARCDELRLVSFIVAAAAATAAAAAAARGVCVMCWQINKFQYLFIRRASARLITGYTAGAQYERGAWQHPRREEGKEQGKEGGGERATINGRQFGELGAFFMFADARNLKVSHITKCEGCRSTERRRAKLN